MIDSGFRIVEELPSGDFVFDAFGRSWEELFVNCARACFFAMTDIERVRPSLEFSFEVSGETPEDLLFNLISELIYLKDSENVFLSDYDLEIAQDKKSLNAVVRGEKIDYNEHTIKTDVKAATYHDLRIIEAGGRYRVRMVLDL